MRLISLVTRESPQRLRAFVFEHLCMRNEQSKLTLWDALCNIASKDEDDVTAILLLRAAWRTHCLPDTESFEAFYRDSIAPRRRAEFAALALPRPMRCLDVGCGDGRVLEIAGDYWNLAREQLWGVDFVDGAPSAAFSRKTIAAHPRYSLPFAGRTFDTVFALQSLHHSADIDASLGEIARVSCAGGRLVVREHNIRDERSERFISFVDLFFYQVLAGQDNIQVCPTYSSQEEWITRIERIGYRLRSVHQPVRCRVYDSVDLVFTKEC